ncbi:hypothetical protein FB562_0453 [Homoserinimonas aerilata]|uniref:Uncharacterized protein n=1 Tax=Homoserinimonas aerilata TaxID=1162970 RepID=A0A542YH19_9MICO|nr:hypothetical protein [Homoserinimonas aerilata]TQL47395.1 hypothetical protein FB562_0453 [Homoserinimonas aerilata]
MDPVGDLRAFKFKPRDVVQSPKQFGKSGLTLKPRDGVERDDPRFGAAQLQHLIANAVRESMLAEGHSLRSYVNLLDGVPGMTYERLVRIQRGDTLMQFADLVAWARRFEAVRSLLTDSSTWPDGVAIDEPEVSG